MSLEVDSRDQGVPIVVPKDEEATKVFRFIPVPQLSRPVSQPKKPKPKLRIV